MASTKRARSASASSSSSSSSSSSDSEAPATEARRAPAGAGSAAPAASASSAARPATAAAPQPRSEREAVAAAFDAAGKARTPAAATTRPPATPQGRTPAAPLSAAPQAGTPRIVSFGDAAERFSGLKVAEWRMRPDKWHRMLEGRSYLPLDRATSLEGRDDNKDHVFVAIVCDVSLPKTDCKGNKFVTWSITDLACPQPNCASLMLFSKACADWDDNPDDPVRFGAVIGILNPNVLPARDGEGPDRRVSLSISYGSQLMRLGRHATIGRCKCRKKNGDACTMPCDLERGPALCFYHAKHQAAQKIRGFQNGNSNANSARPSGVYVLPGPRQPAPKSSAASSSHRMPKQLEQAASRLGGSKQLEQAASRLGGSRQLEQAASRLCSASGAKASPQARDKLRSTVPTTATAQKASRDFEALHQRSAACPPSAHSQEKLKSPTESGRRSSVEFKVEQRSQRAARDAFTPAPRQTNAELAAEMRSKADLQLAESQTKRAMGALGAAIPAPTPNDPLASARAANAQLGFPTPAPKRSKSDLRGLLDSACKKAPVQRAATRGTPLQTSAGAGATESKGNTSAGATESKGNTASVEANKPMQTATKKALAQLRKDEALYGRKVALQLSSINAKNDIARHQTSRFSSLVEEEKKAKRHRLLAELEQQDAMQEHMEDQMEICVAAWRCHACHTLTDDGRAISECRTNGHAIEQKSAKKSRWKCRGCQFEMKILDRNLPSSCHKCNSISWEQVPLYGKRKTALMEKDYLLPRGEELKFLNSHSSNGGVPRRAAAATREAKDDYEGL